MNKTELKKMWDERSSYIKTKNVSTDTIWDFFEPYLSTPSKPLSKVGEVTDEQIDAMILDYLPNTLAVSNGFEKKLARLKMKLALKELRSLLQPSSVDKVVGDEQEIKYGDYVQMNDRFETVHIWSKFLEDENNGRWTPKKITKEVYEQENKKSWNKPSVEQGEAKEPTDEQGYWQVWKKNFHKPHWADKFPTKQD